MRFTKPRQAARRGTAAELKSVIESAQLDVNAPEKLKQQSTINNKKSNSPRPKFETMLHTAARSSSEGVLQYLLDKGIIFLDIWLHHSHQDLKALILLLRTVQASLLSMSPSIAAMPPLSSSSSPDSANTPRAAIHPKLSPTVVPLYNSPSQPRRSSRSNCW